MTQNNCIYWEGTILPLCNRLKSHFKKAQWIDILFSDDQLGHNCNPWEFCTPNLALRTWSCTIIMPIKMHNCKKMHTVGTSYSIFQRVTTAFFGSATLWLRIAIQNDIFSAPWGINDRLSHHKLQSWSASSSVVVKISQDSIPWSVQFLEQKCIPFSFFVKKNYSALFFSGHCIVERLLLFVLFSFFF